MVGGRSHLNDGRTPAREVREPRRCEPVPGPLLRKGEAAIPRCDCSGSTCSCVVIAGSGATVTGAGTVNNPYIVSAGGDIGERIVVSDTATIDMMASGSATVDDPLVISANATVGMDDLTDVEAASPAAGDTITWNGSAWVTGPPAVVPPGAVNVGAGLAGNGSVEDPVRAAVSGVWGTAPLDIYGDDSTVGLAIYVDANGQLRAEPREPESIAWDDITGKPSAFPTTWDQVSGKPSAWPRSGASSGIVSIASGWRLEWQNGQRLGQVCTVAIRVTRTGGTISAGSSGNLANTLVATLTSVWRPFYQGPMSSTSTGQLVNGNANSDGKIYLTATVPNRDITKGSSITLAGTWVCKG